jgi:hypothetical protein
MRALLLLIGIVLTAGTVLAMVKAMLMPRASRSLVADAVHRGVGAVVRAPIGLMRSYGGQDRWLALSPPIAILLELATYVAILIGSLGLVVYGTTDLTIGQALYQSGSTLTTLGIVEPVNVPSAITVYVAAFLGLVVIAIFIGFLMALSAAFTARESPMVQLAALAGEPAWGPMVLLRAHRLGMPIGAAPDAAAWTDWIATTRMNQQVSPVLASMRSTSHRRHWTVSFLAVLDAVALRTAIGDDRPDPADVQLLAVGALALDLLARQGRDTDHDTNWELEEAVLRAVRSDGDAPPAPAREAVGLDRSDVDAVLAGLRTAGIAIADADAAWERFARLRATYFPSVAQLARDLHAVPAPWSGPRRPAAPVIWPAHAELLRAAGEAGR